MITKNPKTHLLIINKKILLVPIIIFVLGAIAYFFIEPDSKQLYLFLKWLFSDSHINDDSLIEWLFFESAPYTSISETNNIIGKRFFWILWLITFTISLFWTGFKIHKQTEPLNHNAIFTLNRPYLIMVDVYDTLNGLCNEHNCKELESLLYSIKCIQEKLSIENDFGYGNETIIECENHISKLLQKLLTITTGFDIIHFQNYIDEANFIIRKVNSLLLERTELKKRRGNQTF